MSWFKTMLYVIAFSLLINVNPVFAAEESSAPDGAQLLSHPSIKGALSAIDAWLEGTRHYEKVPGISAGIVLDQNLVWSKGYGYSNLEEERPADADTVYSICSISKLFTAIGIMQLRDAEKLRLRDTVDEHLDWFNIKKVHEGSGPITIESLLTHSSGLPRESDFPYWNAPEFPFPTREQMIEKLSSQETLYPAQHHFQYSNLALSLAGEIIRARSGQDYQAYIKENILDPLGLADTRPYYPEELRGGQLAIGYTGIHRNGGRDPVEPFFTRGITPAAGFTSSVNDLAKFASWQFRLLGSGGTEVLNANTLREMHRVHWIDPDWETTWGIGFAVRKIGDFSGVGHGGGCPGYITNLSMVPKYKVAAIALTNAGDGPAGNLGANMLKTFGAALEEAQTPPENETPDFSMYEGNYTTRPWGGETAVRQWGDQLVVIDIPSDDLDEAITRLAHGSGHTFIRQTADGEPREPWVFEIGDDGKAKRILRHSVYQNRID